MPLMRPTAFLLSAIVAWSFTAHTARAAGPAPVNLRTAGNFVILTKTGITNVPTSKITGNIGDEQCDLRRNNRNDLRR